MNIKVVKPYNDKFYIININICKNIDSDHIHLVGLVDKHFIFAITEDEEIVL